MSISPEFSPEHMGLDCPICKTKNGVIKGKKYTVCLHCNYKWNSSDNKVLSSSSTQVSLLSLSHPFQKLLASQLSPPSFEDFVEGQSLFLEKIQTLRRKLPITYWLLFPISQMLKPEIYEEWIGDFHEVVYEMLEMHYPYWVIDLVTVGRLVLLGIAGVRIFLQDLSPFSAKRE